MRDRFFYRSAGAVLLVAALTQAQSIHGIVSDAVTKTPVSGATVTFVELSKSCTTDSSGNYASDTVKPGSYLVRVTAPGFLKYSKKVTIASPREAGVSNLELNVPIYNISSNADTAHGNMVVNYSFPGHGNVGITISDAKGAAVRNSFDRSRTGGMRTFSWDGKDNNGKAVPAGRYTCTVVSGRLVMIRTLVVKEYSEFPVKVK